jgi:hypothetical protein
MPYVRQKTWLPLAPKIRGLSVKESPYGMGQTYCDEMTGLDPACGPSGATTWSVAPASTGFPGSDSLTTILNCVMGGGVMNGDVCTYSQPAPSSTNSLASWFQANQGTILVVGGGLLAVALIGGMAKR